MENPASRFQIRLWATCTVLAPLLIAIAQFFWKDGMVTARAGILQVLAFTCWIPAFQGMYHLIRPTMPRFAAIGFALAAYACIGGNNFGVDGIYNEAMGITSLEAANQLHQQLGFNAVLYLFLPGGLFPLSLLAAGILLLRYRRISTAAGILLCIGAICFPLSRIPRIDLLAHLDNGILLIAHLLIARTLLTHTSPPSASASPG